MTPQSRIRGKGPRSRGPKGPISAASRPASPADELHPIDTPPDIESFSHWDLGDEVQGAIAAMGIRVPTPVQRLAIGPVLEGRDVIAKAETGTGKTLAFGAPIVARLDPSRASVLALVLCPTRELAQQVAGVLRTLGEARGLKVALLVGGDPMQPQIKELQKGAQIVVGTPGRVIDLYKQRFLSFPWTEYVVLDEADEMLEIGFLDDVEKILDYTPPERQTLLFSATFPPPLLKLARKHTRTPAEIATAKGVATVDRIQQAVVELADEDRPGALRAMIRAASDKELLLVFCERRTEVDRLMRFLGNLPQSVKALHGGYDQASRFRVMSAFRSGEVRALVATDVASRGLDVSGVTHVINYSVPRDVSVYTHRIGRTGRAGREGKAITLVSPPQGRRWRELEERMTWTVPHLAGKSILDWFGEPRQQRPDPESNGAAPKARRETSRGPRDEERGARTREDRTRPASKDSSAPKARPAPPAAAPSAAAPPPAGPAVVRAPLPKEQPSERPRRRPLVRSRYDEAPSPATAPLAQRDQRQGARDRRETRETAARPPARERARSAPMEERPREIARRERGEREAQGAAQERRERGPRAENGSSQTRATGATPAKGTTGTRRTAGTNGAAGAKAEPAANPPRAPRARTEPNPPRPRRRADPLDFGSGLV